MISNVNYDLSGYAHGWVISNLWSGDNVSGTWNGSSLSNISGLLTGHHGSVNITVGSLAVNGAGYKNSISESHLNLWGGSRLSFTWIYRGSQYSHDFGNWWVGLDLNGSGTSTVEVPELDTFFGLMGLGLLGFAFARKKQNLI